MVDAPMRTPIKPVALAAVLAFTASAAFVVPAAAQEPSKADLNRARTLFQDAVALASANNCAGALVKYREVAQIKMTPQVAFNTAECEARVGRLVSALGNYRVAASQAADDKRAVGVLREAPGRIEELEGRIPKLTITRGKGADTAVIELDGSEIGSGQLGSPSPVDPGSHTIVARIGTKEYLHETVKLGEKETKTFDVKISVAAPKIEPGAPEPGPDKPKEEPAPPKSRVPGIAVTVVGGVVLITGLALLAPRASDISKLSADCKNGHCPVADQSVGSQGALFGTMAGILAPVGAVGVVVGIVLLARSGGGSADKKPDAEEKKDGDGEKKDAFWRSIQLQPSAPGASVGGLSLTGRF
jgi:hypothetical protein